VDEIEIARELWQSKRAAWKAAEKELAAHCYRCSFHLEALVEVSDYRSAELDAAREAVAELHVARDAALHAYDATLAAARSLMRLRDARAVGA